MALMFRHGFAGKLGLALHRWLGIEAQCERGGSAERDNAGHDRANQDVRNSGGRQIGEAVDRATHDFLPCTHLAHRARRTVKIETVT
jgi:hypothetical protein